MELFRALAVFGEPPCDETSSLAHVLDLEAVPHVSEYTELFLFQLYPYASVYLGPEGMLGGDARDRIAGFWRVIGDGPPAEPDHLSAMLALYARIVELHARERQPDRRAACERMRATFLWEHLLTWLPAYLAKLCAIAPPAYVAWGRLLTDALLEDARAVPPPARLPIHCRFAPPIARATTDLDRTVVALLTPIKSGIIVTHADLARAAAMLGLGVRRAERRFVLKAMVEQDAAGVTDWLRQEARAWCDVHREHQATLGAVAEFWISRAAETAGMKKLNVEY